MNTIDNHESVAAVKSGQDPSLAARHLLQQLTEDERLSLLHGDVEFWEGMHNLYTGVYLSTPYVHGETSEVTCDVTSVRLSAARVTCVRASVAPCGRLGSGSVISIEETTSPVTTAINLPVCGILSEPHPGSFPLNTPPVDTVKL
ncbi:uncharacterized protein BDW47DRAFT_113934 [Aspergillus candidus]|uniref:Uncharacterized protein n=1 Tax=Aspergillus candidus TaxID=41067 RepID=A0A2I2EYJ5_ASPCN|nr:hypothetical protein BDW47DRAFT_113934 [Aspergillus candidus]PLB33457.1 hypothetical protein BDW47DRAFT_113934 [Aspergillus candidus]